MKPLIMNTSKEFIKCRILLSDNVMSNVQSTLFSCRICWANVKKYTMMLIYFRNKETKIRNREQKRNNLSSLFAKLHTGQCIDYYFTKESLFEGDRTKQKHRGLDRRIED